MTPLFKKLNLKDHRDILVLDPPESFEAELSALEGVAVHRAPSEGVGFVLAFVRTLGEVRAAAAVAASTVGDAVVWCAYPKASSKRYRCEFNRDSGWEPLGEAGFEPVRQVAIDEDWSALRFRRATYIRSFTRADGAALSEEGRARTAKRSEG